MKWKMANALAGALLLACASTAQAVTTQFVFSGNDHRKPRHALPFDFMMSSGDLDLTVSGHSLARRGESASIITGGIFRNEKIGRYPGGLGILTRYDDDHQVDGRGGRHSHRGEIDEFVQFAFNKEVTIKAIDFSFVGYNDDFRWMVDTSGDGKIGIGDWISPWTDIPYTTIYHLLSNNRSNVFGVGAFGGNDEWKLKKIKVDYELHPVPLPAALPLFAGGLGLLGLLGWRRKRKNGTA